MEARGQLVGTMALLPPCGSQGRNSCMLSDLAAGPLPTEPSHQSKPVPAPCWCVHATPTPEPSCFCLHPEMETRGVLAGFQWQVGSAQLSSFMNRTRFSSRVWTLGRPTTNVCMMQGKLTTPLQSVYPLYCISSSRRLTDTGSFLLYSPDHPSQPGFPRS